MGKRLLFVKHVENGYCQILFSYLLIIIKETMYCYNNIILFDFEKRILFMCY